MLAFFTILSLTSSKELSGRSLILYQAIAACKEHDIDDCYTFSSLYIDLLRESEPSLGAVYDNLEEFLEGTLNGMRKDPDVKSECVVETETIFTPWAGLLSNIEEIVTTGNPIYLFDLPVNVNLVLQSTVAITESCSLRQLSTIVQESFRRNGFGRLLLNLALSYNDTVSDLDELFRNLSRDRYEEAGNYFGKIISILLNFYF